MAKKKPSFSTYIQQELSPLQQSSVQSHMDYLGFGSTVNPGVYAAPDNRFNISALEQVLGGSNVLPNHSHTFMEIFHFTSDSRIEYLIGTHRYILQKGDFACVPPGTSHQILHYEPEDAPCVRQLMAISPNFLESIGWNSKPGSFFLLRTDDAEYEYLRTLFSRCIQETASRPLRWQDTLVGFTHILLALFARNTNGGITAEKDGLLENILSYIDNNLQNRISLVETAAQFYVSERTVNREFQKHLGISFYRYVMQRRLQAAQLMIAGDMPLGLVCQRTGFSDYPTFYRAFRKEYGVSPRQMKLNA